MNALRQVLHRQISHALGCVSEDEYAQKKSVLLAYLRSTQPRMFSLEGGRKRSFEHMAKMEGLTVDEKLEDFALTGYLLQQSFRSIPREDALAAVASCGAPEADRPALEKIIHEIYSSI